MTVSKIIFAFGLFFLVPCIVNCQYTRIPGTLKLATTSTNYLWGVNAGDQIFKCNRPCTGNWERIPGGLSQIDAGEMEVWGVQSSGNIFKRSVDGSGSWVRIPGALKHVSASGNGYVWGVNKDDQIFKCKMPCSGQWVLVDGSLKQIDGGYGYVYGVNVHDDIYTRPIDGSGEGWRRIPGKLKHITASGKSDVFGVNKNDQIFRCNKPCIGEWELMSGRLKQCDATFDSFVGVNSADQIFERRTGI